MKNEINLMIKELPRTVKNSTEFVKLLKSKFETEEDYDYFIRLNAVKEISGAVNLIEKAYRFENENGEFMYPFKIINSNLIIWLDWNGNERSSIDDSTIFKEKLKYYLISIYLELTNPITNEVHEKANKKLESQRLKGIHDNTFSLVDEVITEKTTNNFLMASENMLNSLTNWVEYDTDGKYKNNNSTNIGKILECIVLNFKERFQND